MTDLHGWPRGLSRRDALRLGMLGLGGAGLAAALAACDAGTAPPGSAGPTSPNPSTSGELAAYEPGRPAGPATNLPKRVAWANTSNAEFFLALTAAIESAAKSRGMDFITAIADDDSQRNVQQMEQFLARGIGALVVQPLVPASQTPVMQRALEQGAAVMGLITSPVSMVAVTDQYQVGKTQGEAAAKYIKEKLGGRAEVSYFNQDSISDQLKVRHQGVLDGLKTGGDGIKVVSDIEAQGISNDAGFQTMNTVIQAHPNVKVVLGGDTLVVGAYRALDQAGKLKPDFYLSGVDGDAQALDLIRQGTAYKASLAFAWPVLGYAIGQHACDWIDGKNIPQALVVPPVVLGTAADIDVYNSDMSAPAKAWTDHTLYAKYITPKGNISYASRDDYWRTTYSPS